MQEPKETGSDSDLGGEDTVFFSGAISLFSISSFARPVALRKRGGRFTGLQKSSQEAEQQPSTPINHKAQAIGAAREPLPSLPQRLFALTCQPLPEIYSQPWSPKSLLPVILG